MDEAAAIYQAVLDAVSAAVMAADPAAAFVWFQDPWTMRTLAGEFVIAGRPMFEEGLLAHAGNLRSQGVTDYVRLCRRARYLTPDSIAGAHVTHTLRHATEVVPPYDTRMILVRGPDRWQVSEADHDVLNDRWPVHWLSLPDRRQTGTNNLAEEAQGYLDEMSRVTLAGDWDGYRARVDLPFHLTSGSGNSVVASEAELWPLFQGFHDWLRSEQVTEYLRVVRAAWMLDGGLLSAAYDTHVIAAGQRRRLNSPSQIVLRRAPEGDWRAASIQTPMPISRWSDQEKLHDET
jgi:hypothetical protein